MTDAIINDLSGEEVMELVNALVFYGNPETYFAIGFFPDPPCGDFINDFSEIGDWGWRPGKRAREVLARISQEVE